MSHSNSSMDSEPGSPDSLSVLFNSLDSDNLQWVRSLVDHPGWQIYCQALGELKSVHSRRLITATDQVELYRLQGRIAAYNDFLGVIYKLTRPSQRG